MKMNNYWKNEIPIIMNLYASHFQNYANKQENILIVEGTTDRNFYLELFDKLYIPVGKTKLSLKFERDNIFYNVFYDKNNLNISECFKGEIYKKKAQNIKDDIRNNRIKSLPNYCFVSECIRHYEKNTTRFKNIDCYGLIDQDFGHDDITKGLTKISKTTYHDRETSLLRCYMPNYFENIKNKDIAINELNKAIQVCYKQGILEKCSHQYVNINSDFKSLFIIITHDYFEDRNFLDLDFNDYLENYDKYNQNLLVSDEFNVSYKKFVNFVKKMILNRFSFENDLINLLKRWLIDFRLNDGDIDKLDLIFEYCNGHFLINQMLYCNKYIFGFKSEKEIVDIIKDNIILNKYEFDKIMNIKPIKDYKEYRIKKIKVK